MYATTIKEVIEKLEEIIELSIAKNSRSGYFAALYHHVTCRISEGIDKKEFEDCRRIENLDVIFANRYLEAWDNWQKGKKVTESWRIAFEALNDSRCIVTQHLLLGINAHINLDLGIAAADTMKSESLEDVKQDFHYINQVLSSMVSEVQKRMHKVFPLLHLLRLHRSGTDEMLIDFSIKTARDGAWCFAEELGAGERENRISNRDILISQLARRISRPGRLLTFSLRIIRFFEWKQPSSITAILRGMDVRH